MALLEKPQSYLSHRGLNSLSKSIQPLDGYGQGFSRIEANDFGLWILLDITTTVNELY
jgi:hypothetical protein